MSDDLVILQPNEEGKRTFFDNDPKEEEKEEQIDTSNKQPELQAPPSPRQSLDLNPNLCLSSLDLTAYAYLQEFVTNHDESEERKLLTTKHYPKLYNFIAIMDQIFKMNHESALDINSISLVVTRPEEVTRIINSFVQRDSLTVTALVNQSVGRTLPFIPRICR